MNPAASSKRSRKGEERKPSLATIDEGHGSPVGDLDGDLWERHGKGLGELTRSADDLVVICKTRKEAERAYELIRANMERLELTLNPTKTRIVGLWTGEEASTSWGCTIIRSSICIILHLQEVR